MESSNTVFEKPRLTNSSKITLSSLPIGNSDDKENNEENSVKNIEVKIKESLEKSEK